MKMEYIRPEASIKLFDEIIATAVSQPAQGTGQTAVEVMTERMNNDTKGGTQNVLVYNE